MTRTRDAIKNHSIQLSPIIPPSTSSVPTSTAAIIPQDPRLIRKPHRGVKKKKKKKSPSVPILPLSHPNGQQPSGPYSSTFPPTSARHIPYTPDHDKGNLIFHADRSFRTLLCTYNIELSTRDSIIRNYGHEREPRGACVIASALESRQDLSRSSFGGKKTAYRPLFDSISAANAAAVILRAAPIFERANRQVSPLGECYRVISGGEDSFCVGKNSPFLNRVTRMKRCILELRNEIKSALIRLYRTIVFFSYSFIGGFFFSL